MKISVGAKSDLGLRRSENEDAFVVRPDIDLFVVCDGMGGLSAGEVASRLAVEAIQKAITGTAKIQRRLPHDSRFSTNTNRLGQALAAANYEIYQAAGDRPEWKGMGTTAVAALLTRDRLSIAHAGDSRLYLVRGQVIEQLTQDHSYVGEQVRQGLLTAENAARSPLRNILTRALGPHENVLIELSEITLAVGDRLVLCSDGMTAGVSPKAIQTAVQAQDDAQAVADRLIDLANQAGGEDNTTVIVILTAPV